MTDVSPDTLTTARRLQHEFGMEQRASEGVAIAIYEHTTLNLATKADLHQTEERLRHEMKELGVTLRGEMDELGAALRGEMNEFRATLRGEMNEHHASLRGHTDSSIATLRAEVHGEFKTLYRNLWLMFIGFAGLIVTLTKLLP